DRLEAIDVKHDDRAARVIALDVGNRAIELALKTAPVEDIEQEIHIRRRLQLVDARLRLRQLGPEPANRRFGVVGSCRRPGSCRWLRRGRWPGSRRGGPRRRVARALRAFAALRGPCRGRLGSLLYG